MCEFSQKQPRGALARGELPFGDNPFEELSPAALARVYEWPAEALRFVAGEADCLHVVGDCGMGKTAVLRQIEHRLAAEGVAASYACVPIHGRFDVAELEGEAVVLLDETDRLSRRDLGRALTTLRDAGCRAALAGHRSQLREIRRAGFAPEYLELGPLGSAAKVADVFEARVALAASTGECPCRLTPEAAEALRQHSGGNIERCLEIGYEVFEDLDRLRAIEVADVEAAAASLARALGGAEGSR